MGQALDVVNRYIDIWENKDGEGLADLLSDDFSFVGPLDRPGAAGGWTPYFQVDDLAAMVARAQRLGGEIVVAPMATPGGLGALCIIRDPCGATVGLWQAQTVDGSAASGRHRRPAANTGGGRLRGLTVSFPKSNSNQKEDSHGTGT